ncbi:MAG: SRPBCC family protein [Candidatus Sulfopaludibacter sp.]|nr:SRPBCC family protein [Candidatus Sulfopaludibacter sp.]
MNTLTRATAGLLLLAILIAGGIALIGVGNYGLTVFIAFPVLLGGTVCWVFRPATRAQAVKLGALAALAASASLLLLGREGLICILMALPLAVPLAILGSWLVFHADAPKRTMRGLGMLVLLPPGLLFDATAVPPVYQVRTSIVIAAPPEQVWRHVVSFPELPEPREWYFRAGRAYPQRARIEGSGPGAVRYCDFSTGPFVEPVAVWDEPRLLRFRVTSCPAPMHEWSPYANVVPKHLHGYLVSKQGQFRLTPLPNNRTLLEGTSWYQHGLWPAGYWRLWSDAIIHRIHQRVLTHIKKLSEQSS